MAQKKEAYYVVRPDFKGGESELEPVEKRHIPHPMRYRAEQKRPSRIALVIPGDGNSYFVVTAHKSKADTELAIEESEGKPKLKVIKGEEPRFVARVGDDVYALEVREHRFPDVPAATGMDKKDIGDLCEITDKVRGFGEIMDLADDVADQSGILYNKPRFNVRRIEKALEPAPPEDMAKKIMELDRSSASTIRFIAQIDNIHIPEPVHDALLTRMAEGRFEEEKDREVVGAFITMQEHLITPLGARDSSMTRASKLWVHAAYAHMHIQKGEDELAQEHILEGLEGVKRQLLPPAPHEGDREVIVINGDAAKAMPESKAAQNSKQNIIYALDKMMKKPDAVLRMMRESIKAYDVSREGGREFDHAFKEWMPVILEGVNDPQGHASLSRDAQLKEIGISSRSSEITAPDLKIVLDAVKIFMKTAGSAMVEGHGEPRVSAMMSSALAWQTCVKMTAVDNTHLIERQEDGLATLNMPENMPRIMKAMRHLMGVKDDTEA